MNRPRLSRIGPSQSIATRRYFSYCSKTRSTNSGEEAVSGCRCSIISRESRRPVIDLLGPARVAGHRPCTCGSSEIRQMTPTALTLIVPIKPGFEGELRARLIAIGEDVQGKDIAAGRERPHIDFRRSASPVSSWTRR